jgi:hypothetical protein
VSHLQGSRNQKRIVDTLKNEFYTHMISVLSYFSSIKYVHRVEGASQKNVFQEFCKHANSKIFQCKLKLL